MDLDRHVARSFFTKMVIYNNITIIETITSDHFCFISNLLEHIGVYTDDMITYDSNIVIYRNYKDVTIRTITGSAINIFEGFIKCLKLPNKNMCDICNNKHKCFR